jgi:hypothetical protein
VRDVLRAASGLVRNTARMAGLEAREVARRLARRIALLVGAATLAAAGGLLVLTGLALLGERALDIPRWAAFVAVGVLAAGAGALGISAAIRRLGRDDLAFPETLAEIVKDAEAISARREEP